MQGNYRGKKLKEITYNLSSSSFRIEQDIRNTEADINKKRPTFIKAKERVTHMQKKVESAKKSLAQARKANAAHAEDIAELEAELTGLEQRREEYEESLQSESQSQGRSVHLEEEQVCQHIQQFN